MRAHPSACRWQAGQPGRELSDRSAAMAIPFPARKRGGRLPPVNATHRSQAATQRPTEPGDVDRLARRLTPRAARPLKDPWQRRNERRSA